MMEIKSKNRITFVILISIAIGIWAIVLQNAGLIPTNHNVSVVNTVDVSGSVDVDNTVEIQGSVEVDNTVNVCIEEVLGRDGKKYYFNNR